MNYIKTILILLTAIFFISCGSDEDITVSGTTDISHIKIDENNGSARNMYATEKLILHSTVYYDDGSSQDATKSVSWINSDYSKANLTQNLVEPKSGNGDFFVTASYKEDFNDTVLIHLIGIQKTEIHSYTPITTTGWFDLYLTAYFSETNETKTIYKNIVWNSNNDSTITVTNDIATLYIPHVGDINVTADILGIHKSIIFNIK